MHFSKLIIFCLSFLYATLSHSQEQTVGLLHSSWNVSDGYTLFTPELISSVYLVDNCGEKINEWTFSERPGLTCYLLEDGNLLRSGRDSIELRDWDNNLLWSYALTLNGHKQHHDIAPLPNGNILCLIRVLVSNEEIIEEGRDTTMLDEDFKLEKVIELQPIGTNDAEVVWEWSFVDHLIQEYDSTKLNYGVVVDHPELLDLNFENNYYGDYIHTNGIDYNAELDQVLITARHLSEIYIIDHSTTTEEAAGNTGGNSNRGGDFLWRWGNTPVYQQGTASDQKLVRPHDAKWVNSDYLDGDKLSVFNNGGDGSGTFSSIHLMDPLIEDGVYQKDNDQFTPVDFDWSWDGDILGNTVNESKKCGAQSLPNGNFMICENSLGQVSEITKEGVHLWTYRNPVGLSIFDQLDSITDAENRIFRAEKYPSDYLGFVGQDLSPQGIIEDENTKSDTCALSVGIAELEKVKIQIVNPVQYGRIQFTKGHVFDAIIISDLSGKIVYEQGYFEGSDLDIDLNPSMYIMQLLMGDDMEVIKIIVRE